MGQGKDDEFALRSLVTDRCPVVGVDLCHGERELAVANFLAG